MNHFRKLQSKSIRVFNTFVVIFIFSFLFSCVTGSTIITGTKRSAINPSEVKIYLDAPAQYENIGIIEVQSDILFSRQDAQDEAMNGLKSRTAKVGTNGILLTGSGNKSVETTGYYSNGIFYGGSSEVITAQGRAIFVTQE